MPGCHLATRRPLETALLARPRPLGPFIGQLGGIPFAEMVSDAFGRRYTYLGLAPRRAGGRIDLDALRSGEFIVEPGLLYRVEGAKSARDGRQRGLMNVAAFTLLLLLGGTLLAQLLSIGTAPGAG